MQGARREAVAPEGSAPAIADCAIHRTKRERQAMANILLPDSRVVNWGVAPCYCVQRRSTGAPTVVTAAERGHCQWDCSKRRLCTVGPGFRSPLSSGLLYRVSAMVLLDLPSKPNAPPEADMGLGVGGAESPFAAPTAGGPRSSAF